MPLVYIDFVMVHVYDLIRVNSPAFDLTHEEPSMSAITREGNTVTITPGQDVVSTAVPALKQELSDLIAEGVSEIFLDLTGTNMMDSIGIGVIIATHNSMKKKGGKLMLVHVSENILKLFKSMRLDQHLNLAG